MMAANVRTGSNRSPLFLVSAIAILVMVGVLAVKAPSWAGALSSYAVESSYYLTDHH
jgi:hypothetical protein